MVIILLLLLLLLLIGTTFCIGRVVGRSVTVGTVRRHLVHLRHSIYLNCFLEESLFDVFLSVRFGHVQCFEEHSLAGRVLERSKPQYESDNNVFYTTKTKHQLSRYLALNY